MNQPTYHIYVFLTFTVLSCLFFRSLGVSLFVISTSHSVEKADVFTLLCLLSSFVVFFVTVVTCRCYLMGFALNFCQSVLKFIANRKKIKLSSDEREHDVVATGHPDTNSLMILLHLSAFSQLFSKQI